MLVQITNNKISPVYHVGNFTFKNKYVSVTKRADCVINNQCNNKKPVALLFASTISKLINITGWKMEFDKDTGKFLRICKYENGGRSIVKHFSNKLFRWKSIDEYKDGNLAKTTNFYSGKNIPDWEIIYKEDGNDVMTEFYPNGKTKSRQYDKNGYINCKDHFDENGKRFKHEQFNPDETLAYVILYNNNYNTLESYQNGILKYKEDTFNDGNIWKIKTYYNEKKEITKIEETGSDYSAKYIYKNGKKIESITEYYNNDEYSSCEIKYGANGVPITESYYGLNRILCKKRENLDNGKEVLTKYNDQGKVILMQTVHSKTNTTQTRYSKK